MAYEILILFSNNYFIYLFIVILSIIKNINFKL
jgi:hypothetical protein